MSVTRHRDLRTGRSVWFHRRGVPVPHAPLTRDLSTDIIVVGAGISGAMVAESLADAGRRVVIVDRRPPVLGSTPASTALLQYEIDTPMTHLARLVGVTRAERLWRRSKLALDALGERVRHLGIEASTQTRSSLYLDGNVLDAGALRAEGDARRRAGFEVAYLPPRLVEARTGIRRRHALLGHGNMTADPRRLAAGFLNAAIRRGARICSPVVIEAVEAGRSGVVVATAEGPVLRASTLVFATGYELPKGVPRSHHTIVSTYAIATRPQPRALWADGSLLWEASDPYLYMRPGPDGRIICGGEDENFSDATTRDALLAAKTTTIERKLAALLPGVDPRADYAWCGTFGASDTGTPSIGPVPRMPGCYAVLGYGGNGITFSALAAQLLRNQITGDGDPDSDLFSFRR
jgi:glycine/D-amino acid oxidase-like deaminating enzyme